MACQIDNNHFEMVITPSRKRKRCSERYDAAVASSPAAVYQSQHQPGAAVVTVATAAAQPEPSVCGMINAAFSSTPKKQAKNLIESFQRFSHKPSGNKENAPFPVNSCLEVKSILDIVNNKKVEAVENQYEVVRKPPKKKKKADIAESCFENPALNLDGPEKQFNPFEVMRAPPVVSHNKTGFSNQGLNIRTQEVSQALNPFEIKRFATTNPMVEASRDGFENPALEIPTAFTIGLPFIPTVGCRIDFKNFPLDNLTPSKLLAEKLVFSPVINSALKTPKPQSLSVISEEAIDIGKELDCYQLELENSINEAKMRKTGRLMGRVQTSFGARLEEIEETDSEDSNPIEIDSKVEEILKADNEPKTPSIHEQVVVEELQIEEEVQPTKEFEPKSEAVDDEKQEKEDVQVELDDVSFFDDDEDDEINFKAPAPFVRAYRKADTIASTHSSKESLTSNKSKESTSDSNKVTNLIRKSIRKLMHPKSSSSKKDEKEGKPETEASSLLGSIRHSLRRRPNKAQPNPCEDIPDISIIDCSERTKYKSSLIQTDYIKIEDVVTEKKYSLRNSIKKSTRGVRNHVLKSVFHKNVEEYQLQK